MLNTNYVLPETLVYQTLSTTATAGVVSMYSYIVGPNAQLVRYSVATEKASGYLNYYNPATTTTYEWDGIRDDDTVLDTSYTKIFVENAMCRYFASSETADANGGYDLTNSWSGVFYAPAGAYNKVQSDTFNFKTNPDALSHVKNPALQRTVEIGDVVRVSFDKTINAGEPIAPVIAKVIDITNDDSSFTAAATANSANTEAHIGNTGTSIDLTDTTVVGLEGVTGTLSNFTGVQNTGRTVALLVSVTDTGESKTAALYLGTAVESNKLAEVTALDWSNNTLTAAFTISGTPPAAFGSDFTGVTATFTRTDVQEFTGNTYTANAILPYNAVSIGTASFETTANIAAVTYDINVTADCAWASVATNTTVTNRTTSTAATFTFDVATRKFVIDGKYDFTLVDAVNGSVAWGLKSGNGFVFISNEVEGLDLNTLVLSYNLPAIVTASVANTPVHLELMTLASSLEMPTKPAGVSSEVYWSATEENIMLYAGWQTTLVADDLTTFSAPIFSASNLGYGKVYVQFRAWSSAATDGVHSATYLTDLDSYLSGPITPDNPLKYAISKAFEGAGNYPILFCAVSDPANLDSWQNALDYLSNRSDGYNLVPLTQDPQVQSLFIQYVNENSTALNANECCVWLNKAQPTDAVVVSSATSANKQDVYGKFVVNPNNANYFNYFVIDAETQNGNFVDNGVKAGDTLSVYEINTNTVIATHRITNVVNDSTLVVAQTETITNAEKNTNHQIIITRTLTGNDLAEAIAESNGYGNRRIRLIWPDTIVDSGYQTVYGYNVCATLAAMSSAVVPQQGLTQYVVPGYTAVPRTAMFNRSELNLMGRNGIWIIAEDIGGAIYTRHAVTTASYDVLMEREEMIGRNIDNITKYIRSNMQGFIGTSNVSESNIVQIELQIVRLLDNLKNRNYTDRLGNQIISYSNLTATVDTVYKDRVVVNTNITIPSPLNNLDIYLNFTI